MKLIPHPLLLKREGEFNTKYSGQFPLSSQERGPGSNDELFEG